MKTLAALFLLSLTACSTSQMGILKYEDVDRVEFVNAAIDRSGVQLNLSEEHTDGKGILAITDSATEGSNSIFTIVSISRASPESLIIVNEVPTTEGMFVLTTEINGGKQSTSFQIRHWPSSISFKTTFSRVTLASSPNSKGVTSGKVEYKGKSQVGQREIELVSEFYFEKD